MNRRPKITKYTVAWICALPIELAAARHVLDEEHEHEHLQELSADSNSYVLGQIHMHNVVLACLPAGQIGTNAAAIVATQINRSFPSIRFILMVGIGGGVPGKDADMRLGDVVVSQPSQQNGGVIQHDMGKSGVGGTHSRTGFLNSPPALLLTALSKLKSTHHQIRRRISDYMDVPIMNELFDLAGVGEDVLYEAGYNHISSRACSSCSPDSIVQRSKRTGPRVEIHYGTIASGNQVMRDGITRDRISQELGGVLCFEMEAAALMNNFQCLVVRGICDYSDSHKNKAWQPYAAISAAAYAREVLLVVPPFEPAAKRRREDPRQTLTNDDSLMDVVPFAKTAKGGLMLERKQLSSYLLSKTNYEFNSFVKSFWHYNYRESFENINMLRYRGTCEWLIRNEHILWLISQRKSSLLWMYGAPGVGKSTLLSYMITTVRITPRKLDPQRTFVVLYSYCNDQRNQTASKVLAVIVHQLLIQFPQIQQDAFLIDRSDSIQFHVEDAKQRPATQLWHLILVIIAKLTEENFLLIVDALDECKPSSQEELLRLFSGINSTECNIKVLFSSRPTYEIRRNVSQYTSRSEIECRELSIQDYEEFVKQDVLALLRGEVDKITVIRGLSLKERELIKVKLSKDLTANFLPISLKLKEIEQYEDRPVADILEEIPTDLQLLYQSLLDQIPKYVRPTLHTILKFVMYTFTPLSVKDLASACGRGTDDESLSRFRHSLSQFATFLGVRKYDDVVSFHHISAKEFFASKSLSDHVDNWLPKPGQSHLHIAELCLGLVVSHSRLEFPVPWSEAAVNEERAKIVARSPFVQYSMRFWHRHLKMGEDVLGDKLIVEGGLAELVRRFMHVWRTATDGFRYSLLTYSGLKSIDAKTCQSATVIEILSALGATSFLRLYLPKTNSGDIKVSPVIQSSLRLAILSGHESTVNFIIEFFNVESLDDAFFEGIYEDSVRHNNPRLLDIMMRLRGVRVKELVVATSVAFSMGQRDALHKLIGDGSTFEFHDQNSRTLLHHFFLSHHGNLEMDSRLALAQIAFYVENGVDINAKDRFGYTALHYACDSTELCKHDLIVGMIQYGANPTIETQGGLTPLHLASRFSRDASVLKSLIYFSGHEILWRASKGGNTALHWAANRPYLEGSSDILDVLVKNGADPYKPNRLGCSPMDKAPPELREHMTQIFARLTDSSSESLLFQAPIEIEDIPDVEFMSLVPQNPFAVKGPSRILGPLKIRGRREFRYK